MTADAPSSGKGLRVLVVDDNRDCAYTTVMLLRHLGHEGRPVYDAGSALAAIVEFRPQLILLDLAMPGKDGLSLARELRSDGACFVNVPLVAMTGYADSVHREKAANAGFDAYLVKPCGINDLRVALSAAERLIGDGKPRQ